MKYLKKTIGYLLFLIGLFIGMLCLSTDSFENSILEFLVIWITNMFISIILTVVGYRLADIKNDFKDEGEIHDK